MMAACKPGPMCCCARMAGHVCNKADRQGATACSSRLPACSLLAAALMVVSLPTGHLTGPAWSSGTRGGAGWGLLLHQGPAGEEVRSADADMASDVLQWYNVRV